MSEHKHIGAARDSLKRLSNANGELDLFVRGMKPRLSETENEFYQEATKRLRQLCRLLEFLIPVLSKADAIENVSTPPLLDKGQEPDENFRVAYDAYIEKLKSGELKRLAMIRWDVWDDMQIFTESFYYFAFRARTVIRALPGLKNFECVGVRNVRNKLIEHAERADSQIMGISFGWGSTRGPIVKAHRSADKKDLWVDQGLFVNSDEFSQNLEITIARASAGGK